MHLPTDHSPHFLLQRSPQSQLQQTLLLHQRRHHHRHVSSFSSHANRFDKFYLETIFVIEIPFFIQLTNDNNVHCCYEMILNIMQPKLQHVYDMFALTNSAASTDTHVKAKVIILLYNVYN